MGNTRNIDEDFRGVFPTLAELERQYPAATNAGQQAAVLTNGAQATYVCDGMSWGAVVSAKTNPLTGVIELTAAGEVVEVGGGSGLTSNLVMGAASLSPFPNPSDARDYLLVQSSQLWLFAGQYANITTDQALSGAAITLGAASAAPVYDAVNGYTFDGTDDYAYITLPNGGPSPSITISILMERLAASSTDRTNFSIATGGGGGNVLNIRDSNTQIIGADGTTTFQANFPGTSVAGAWIANRNGWTVMTATYDGRYWTCYSGDQTLARIDCGAYGYNLRDTAVVGERLYLAALSPSTTLIQFGNIRVAAVMVANNKAMNRDEISSVVESLYSATDLLRATTNKPALWSHNVLRNGGNNNDFLGISPIYVSAAAWPENEHTQYRKTFMVAAVPPTYPIKTGGSGQFRVFVNGVLVQGMNPRQTSLRLVPTLLDIAPYLVVGTNVIVIENYQRGRFARSGGGTGGWGDDYGFGNLWRGNAGVFILDGGSLGLTTNTTWKGRVAPEYTAHDVMCCDTSSSGVRTKNSTNRYTHNTHLVMSAIEVIHTASYSDSAWPAAVLMTHITYSLGIVPDETYGNYESRHNSWALAAWGSLTTGADSAYVEFAPTIAGKRYQAATLTANDASVSAPVLGGGVLTMQGGAKDVWAILDLSTWRYGAFELDISASGSGTLDVIFGDDGPSANKVPVQNRGNNCGGDTIALSAGSAKVRIGYGEDAPRGGRYLVVVLRSGSAGVSLTPTISQWSICRETSDKVVSTNDPTIKFIWQAGGNALLANHGGGSADNVMRDGGNWIANYTARATQWLTGDSSIARKELIEVIGAMRTDKVVVSSIYPNWAGYGRYDWSWTTIPELYKYYMWTGNRDLVRNLLDPIDRMIAGIVGPASAAFAGETLPYTWGASEIYGDYNAYQAPSSATTDFVNFLVQHGQLAEALSIAAYLAAEVGAVTKARAWRKLAALTKAKIKSWTVAASGGIPAHPMYPTTGAIGSWTTFSAAGVMWSLAADAIHPEHVGPLMDYLCPEDGSLPALPATGTDWAMPGFYEIWPRECRRRGRNPWPLMQAWLANNLQYGYMPETRNLGVYALNDVSGARGSGTRCHNWNAAVVTGFIEGCLGAAISAPGGAVTWNPVANLPDFETQLFTPKGKTTVRVRSGVLQVGL